MPNARYIEELREAIRRLHGVDSKLVETIAVRETFQAKTVCNGFAEVFELVGHANAHKASAWSHETDNPSKPKRHVAVLHFGPVNSAAQAVRAAIAQEFREIEPEPET
jgi:hypothetical protein